MGTIKFLIALFGGKLASWLWKITGNERDDRPGMLSVRICSDFLKRVGKPKLTIVVTGTNGKTSISNTLASIFKSAGMTVAFNDWGANHHAGQAKCLLDAVNIFNRPIKDVAIIEADELISPENIPQIQPDYVIINNLARDSMLRNANPEFIRGQLEKAVSLSPKSTLILCADDPLSCLIGSQCDNKKIYFGVSDMKRNPLSNRINDFSVCPKCGGRPEYTYRNYRHIGDFYCTACDFKSFKRDYFTKALNKNTKEITVAENSGDFTYKVISSSIYSVYNFTAIISLLRDYGFSQEKIAELFKTAKLPSSRETRNDVCDVNIVKLASKGQNATACSTVFETVNRDKREKEVVLMLDEVFSDPKKSETIAWIYDTDYEFLNSPHIRKIICGGERYLDHKLRLLLAGIPEEKIICIREPLETAEYVNVEGLECIYVLHDVNSITRGRLVCEKIEEKIKNERGALIENRSFVS